MLRKWQSSLNYLLLDQFLYRQCGILVYFVVVQFFELFLHVMGEERFWKCVGKCLL